MPFTFTRLQIPDLILIEPTIFEDERGFFLETYKLNNFASIGIFDFFVQENHSFSYRDVLRGLHYQNPPKAQGKLISVIKGEIYDVAVDIRKGSPDFGKWVGVNLSENNRSILYIPQGFAHGFCVLSESAGVIYKTTEFYTPALEAGIIYNDIDLKIDWPITNPILSEKDKNWPEFKKVDFGFYFNSRRGY